MALINPGPSGELAGTIGGTTYARNKAGAYARAWAKPINPNTGKQSTARGNFAYGAGAWAVLTLAEKTAWNAYANSITRLNRFGFPYTPSGRQIYMELASNAMTTGNPPNVAPPVATTVPGISASGVNFNVTTPGVKHLTDVNINGLAVSNATNPNLLVYATPLQPSSRTNFKKYLRLLIMTAVPVDPPIPADIGTAWNAAYTTPVIDPTMQYIGIAIRAVDLDTYLGSATLYFPAEIAP